MKTKYDIGDTVLVPFKVHQICIRENKIEYQLDNESYRDYVFLEEDEIASKVVDESDDDLDCCRTCNHCRETITKDKVCVLHDLIIRDELHTCCTEYEEV